MSEYLISDGTLERVVAIAHNAGRRIMDDYQTGFSIGQKSDASTATQADRAGHDQVSAALLHTWTPSIPIVSEGRMISDDERAWFFVGFEDHPKGTQ